jgi:aryl-alcohol dehydrogenase-like predicted oxidoreductase
MEYRKCGKSELELSVIGAGCWAFGGGEYWGDQNQQDVNNVVHRSVDLGINYFDTAEAYNAGRSEESLGLAIKGLPRNKLVIGTKVSPSNAYGGKLIEHCEASLKRLGTDYIDLYMIHWPIHPHSIRHFTDDGSIIDNPPSLSEACEALARLRQQGKIRHMGVSNFAVARLKEVLELNSNIVVNELPYSLLTRAIEIEMIPCCNETGVGIIGYMTLLQGVLADIYETLADVPEWQRRTRHFNCKSSELCRHGEEGAEQETNETLAGIREVMKQTGMSMPELAVKWVVSNKNISSALVGARNREELEANVKAASEPLDGGIVNELNKATTTLMSKLGPGFDFYESVENDRTR